MRREVGVKESGLKCEVSQVCQQRKQGKERGEKVESE